MHRSLLPFCFLAALLSTAPARAMPLFFEATLDGGQEVPPVVNAAGGTATLELNAAQDRLEIMIQLFGLDLDGAQTPGAGDNVLAGHIHAAPAGANGGVVFGFLSPNNDTNGDLVIDAVAGTIFSGWDLNEGQGTTLAAELPALLAGGLYLNFHTPDFPAGAVRGQIMPRDPGIPVPGSGLLLGAGLLVLGVLRGRVKIEAT